MEAQLRQARQRLEQGDVEQAAQLARATIESQSQGGDASGLAEALRVLVAAHVPPSELAALAPTLEDGLERCRRRGDKLAEARTLLAVAELQNASMEPDLALEAVEQIQGLGQLGEDVDRQVLAVSAAALVAKQDATKATGAARKLLASAQRAGNKEVEAAAWQALVGALALREEDSHEMLEAARSALSLYRESHLRVGQASAHADVARALLQSMMAKDAIQAASDSLNLWRELGQSKGVVAALELIIQAEAMQNNTAAGLRAANRELETVRRAGDKRGQVDLLDMMAHTHAMLREPISGMHYARQALELYWSLGDLAGQGWTLHSLAEMQRMEGKMGEATSSCQQALATFKAVGSRRGQERASSTLNSLFAERGLPEKAPKRSEALRTLRDFAQAVQGERVDAAKAAEGKLNSLRNLVTDEEVAGALAPLVSRDETASFLEEQLGWQLDRKERPVSSDQKGDLLHNYSHKAFYLNTIMNGMNFGPQFRAVHPWRKGEPAKDGIEGTWCMSASQLGETEGWQMETLYRHGIMDSGFQVGSVAGF